MNITFSIIYAIAIQSCIMIPNNYSIKNLLNDLGLSSQTTVAKQNGELSIEENIIEDGDEIQLVQIIYGG